MPNTTVTEAIDAVASGEDLSADQAQKVLREIMSGERARISFAPMVWGAGLLMAWEALKLRLGKGSVASC